MKNTVPNQNCSEKPTFLPSVTVEKAAIYFSVSTRRIRKLLAEGRLAGSKNGKLWQVSYPYQFTIGTRGPQFIHRQKLGINIRP